MKNQEKFKEIMEQLRSQKTSNNVAKVSVQEKAVGNMNARSITQGEEEEMYSTPLNKSLASLTTYSYQTTPENATEVGSDGAIIGLMPPNYYYAEFRMDLTTVANYFDITEEKLRSCFLVVTPENVSSGYCAFTIVNSVGDTLLTWNNNVGGEIELSVEDVYNGEQDEIYFKLMPMMGINGMVGFPICGVALKKNTPFMKNAYYGNEPQEDCPLQVMDIYVPKNADGTYKTGSFPVVITIHGGSWCRGSKEYYNYMTDFITDTCNCVHVNMNYRLTTGVPWGNDITYEDMLDDIQLVIKYLNDHSAVYHVDTSKIALMGYSAGGHLALLYAYSTADNYANPNDNPVKLVISEAGPTDFTTRMDLLRGSAPDQDLMENLLGKHDGKDSWMNKIEGASPIKNVPENVGDNFPYTILAYGNLCDDNGDFTGTDGIVDYEQATLLEGVLKSNNLPYSFYTFKNVAHGEFGEGGRVYPNVKIEPNDNIENQTLKTEILKYYGEISSKI